jgi:D-alanyl-D-alanine carboxypeptidase
MWMYRRQFLAAAGASAGMVLTPKVEARPADTSPLNVFIADKLKETDFGGTILIVAQGRTLLRQGYGLAERAFAVPCTTDTAYCIASITKLFTATIVLRMWDAGRIDPDAPIATYLPGYKGGGARTVKVRHLLNHTSGIENFDKGLTSYAGAAKAGLPAYQIPHTSRELMDLFASGPLMHAPGTVFDYNNADYVILGQIIEAIEGMPFDQVVSRDITAPLAMSSTGMALQQRIVPRLASTYYSDEKAPLTNDLPVYAQNWYAAGGMYSTVDDLLVFAVALYGNRLVSAAKLAALLTPGLDDYGFGLWISTLDVSGRKHRFAQRPGRIMGANTLLLRMLDDDITIVILANTNLVDTDRLGFQIARQVIQAKPRS